MLDNLWSDPLGRLLLLAAGFLVGVCLGSFSTAIADRTASSSSWIFKSKGEGAARSRCPNCRHQLAWYDLVPLFSWLLLRGHCRYCRASISAAYPMTELSAGGLTVAAMVVYGISISFFITLAGLPFFLAAAQMSMKGQFVPVYMRMATLGLVVLVILNIIVKVF